MKVFVTMALFCAVTTADRPNYITDEEFAKVRNVSIEVSNTTSVQPTRNFSEPLLTRPGFGPNLWTNAQVPYTLDSSFDDNQRSDVALALEEYHSKTCIRFIPKESTDSSWVDIQYDPDVCGVADLCMNSGGQSAKFGGSCVTAGVMVHELGHTLCMSHEQTRLDRDDWIQWNTDMCEVQAIDPDDFNRGLHKLYDYLSVEHYEDQCYSGCIIPKETGVTKCGSGGTLSVLDAEILNEMYGCNDGCLGFRYVNSKNDLSDPPRFGTDTDEEGLLSCRAYFHGDIIPGKYHPGKKECYVPYGGEEHIMTDDHVEILTNPNGVEFSWVRQDSVPSNAIPGGRSAERETLYPISCEMNWDGQQRYTPGKYHPSVGAFTSYGGGEYPCKSGTYEFIICS